jgi:DNA-binding Xre family transcriptional regulator
MITLRLTEDEYKALQNDGALENVKPTKFAKLLVEHGETVNSLSRATGISRPTLYRYYYGEKVKGIQFDTLDALCKHFGMSVQDVIDVIRPTQMH